MLATAPSGVTDLVESSPPLSLSLFRGRWRCLLEEEEEFFLPGDPVCVTAEGEK